MHDRFYLICTLVKHIMKKLFFPLMFLCLALVSKAQENYKVSITTLLLDKTELKAGLSFCQMNEQDLLLFKQKVQASSTYSVLALDYFKEKQLLQVFLRSESATIIDFSDWLQELHILKLVYNAESIATTDLSLKYKPQMSSEEGYTPTRLKR